MNEGRTGAEIAEMIEVPPALEKAWHTHGYYGSVSHNVKAIYQRYMGWFDGNPAHLWEHPPTESAKRYVQCMGGVEAVLAKARGYVDAGDLRFATELLNHVVFARPEEDDAKALLAEVYERLGFGAECGTWRNIYLTGAQELRHGARAGAASAMPSAMTALTIEQLFDAVAIRVNGPRAWSEAFAIDWDFTDEKKTYRMVLSNGALVHGPASGPSHADLRLTLDKPGLFGLLAGKGLEGIQTSGDASVLQRLLGLLDEPDPGFAIVTPE